MSRDVGMVALCFHKPDMHPIYTYTLAENVQKRGVEQCSAQCGKGGTGLTFEKYSEWQ